MINRRIIIINIAILAILLVPFLSYAQTPLIDCDNCGYEDFINTIGRIIDWFITIAASLSALGFAYVGFILLTKGADSTARDKAKDIFSKIAIGFFFVLASWLIVELILSVLVDSDSAINFHLG